jgi:hypothetical protein
MRSMLELIVTHKEERAELRGSANLAPVVTCGDGTRHVSLTLFCISTIIAGVQNTVTSFTNIHNIAISRYIHVHNPVNHCPVMVYSASCLRPTRGEPQVVVGGGAVLVAAGCSGPPLVVVGWTGCVLKYLSRPGTSFEIILSILLSATKAGMLPPGVLDVAISQRVFLSGSSVIRSTLT